MHPTRVCMLALAFAGLAYGSAGAADRATKEQAVAMVQKAVAAIKSAGAEKIYKDVTGKAAEFEDRDLYIAIYCMDGTVLAHGSNAKLVGKKMIDAEDVDGKPFVKERVELARTQPSFWQDYKFVDPLSKKVEPKQMYCERLDETVVCGGVYKI